MTNTTTFILRAGIVYLEVEDGTSRLLDFGNRFYALSTVATRMLQATLEENADVAAERLAREYSEPTERIRADLAAFLDNLERKRLICRTGNFYITERMVEALAYVTIIPILWGVRPILGLRGKVSLLLALAWLNCRMLGWTYTVRAWRIGCACRAVSVADPEATMRDIDATIRSVASAHPLPVECKERALTTWIMARISGVPADLVVGVHFFPLEGHCWCTYNGVVYSDDAERCAQFKPVWWCS